MTSRISLLSCCLVLFGTLAACGGGNVGEQSVPEATLSGEGLNGNMLRINPPDEPDRQGSPAAFNIESTGDSELKLTSIQLEPEGEIPERLLFNGERTETNCEFDATVSGTNDSTGSCSNKQYCNVVTGFCHEAAPPETPLTVDSSREFSFRLAASQQAEIICPDPPEEQPENFVSSTAAWNQIRQDYCGEIRIETNARNDGSQFSGGSTRVYLLSDTGSGQIAVDPGALTFEGVEAGMTTDPQTLTILNEGRGTLTIDGINIQGNSEFVDLSGPSFPKDIPGSNSDSGAGSETWEVAISIPEDTKEEDIPSNSRLTIRSSAANEASASISIDQASLGPAIELVDGEGNPKTAMSFKNGNEQTINIKNEGVEDETLLLQNASFELFQNCPPGTPSCDRMARAEALNNAYEVTIGDSDPIGIEPGPQGANLRSAIRAEASIRTDDEPQPVTVTYTGDSDNPPPLGYLVLTHNDSTSGNTARIALLGPRDGALVEGLPSSSLNFTHGDQEQTRTLLLRNQGTSSIEMEAPSDDQLTSAFRIENPDGDNATWTIPAEGLKPIDVTFVGSTDQEAIDTKTVKFQSIEEAVQEQITFKMATRKEALDLDASIQRASDGDPSTTVGSRLEVDASTMPELDRPRIQWMVLQRPDASRIFRAQPARFGGDSSFTIRPDEPGTYQIGFTVRPGSRGTNGQAQAIETFEVIESSEDNSSGN